MFLIASQKLSELVNISDLQFGVLYPAIEQLRNVSIEIAVQIVKYVVEHKLNLEPLFIQNEAAEEEHIYQLIYDLQSRLDILVLKRLLN